MPEKRRCVASEGVKEQLLAIKRLEQSQPLFQAGFKHCVTVVDRNPKKRRIIRATDREARPTDHDSFVEELYCWSRTSDMIQDNWLQAIAHPKEFNTNIAQDGPRVRLECQENRVEAINLIAPKKQVWERKPTRIRRCGAKPSTQ